MDVILYKDGKYKVTLDTYKECISSVISSTVEPKLTFIMYVLDTPEENEEIIKFTEDKGKLNNLDASVNLVLTPDYIKEYKNDHTVGHTVTVVDDGLYSLINVMSSDKVIFLRLGDILINQLPKGKEVNTHYDVSGICISTVSIKFLLNTIVSTKFGFLTSEQLRLLIDTFYDADSYCYFELGKTSEWTENAIHKESLLDLYQYLVSNVYTKVRHMDQFKELNSVLGIQDSE